MKILLQPVEEDKEGDRELEGEFTKSLFDLERAGHDRFSHVLSAYSASNISLSSFEEIVNEMDGDHHGTILYVSNSFSWHVIPYLAMECDKVYFLHIDEKDHADEVIRMLQPDIVIEAPF